MKFAELPLGLTVFIHFREFLGVFRDLEKTGKLVADGETGFDPSDDAVFICPNIGIAVFNKLLRHRPDVCGYGTTARSWHLCP